MSKSKGNESPKSNAPTHKSLLTEEIDNSSKSILSRKTKRDPLINDEPENPIIFQLKNEIRCSICLEYEKFANPNKYSKCKNCSKCNAIFHIECYNKFFPTENKSDLLTQENFPKNFFCQRCLIENQNPDKKIICFICGEHEGILKNIVDDKFAHHYCLVFMREISGTKVAINKARFMKCKICKIKNEYPVVKCETKKNYNKCNNKYHINCAVKNGIIMSLAALKENLDLDFNDKIQFVCYQDNEMLKNYITTIQAMINSENESKQRLEEIKENKKENDNEKNNEEENIKESYKESNKEEKIDENENENKEENNEENSNKEKKENEDNNNNDENSAMNIIHDSNNNNNDNGQIINNNIILNDNNKKNDNEEENNINKENNVKEINNEENKISEINNNNENNIIEKTNNNNDFSQNNIVSSNISNNNNIISSPKNNQENVPISHNIDLNKTSNKKVNREKNKKSNIKNNNVVSENSSLNNNINNKFEENIEIMDIEKNDNGSNKKGEEYEIDIKQNEKNMNNMEMENIGNDNNENKITKTYEEFEKEMNEEMELEYPEIKHEKIDLYKNFRDLSKDYTFPGWFYKSGY